MAAPNPSTGMFNFDEIMKEFYEWTPDDKDVAGQALKNTFQGDFIQTVLNNEMSKELAFTNAEIATGQMTSAAMLELANQTAIMKDEFEYGMEKMGSEYDYQSQFATDEANREINKLGYTADLQQNQTKLEGDQNRLNIEAQGVNDVVLQDQKNKGALDQINSQGNIDEKLQGIKGDQVMEQLKASGLNDQALQELKNSGAIKQIVEQGSVDKVIEDMKQKGTLNQIGAQGIEALKQIDAQGFLENELQKLKGGQATDQISAQGDVDVTKIGAQTAGDVTKIGAQTAGDVTKLSAQGSLDQALQKIKGTQATDQIGAQGKVDKDIQGMKGTQALGQIKETGKQEREGMMQATTEDTKTQKRDSKMARSLAGMF